MTSKEKELKALDTLAERANITAEEFKCFVYDTTNEPYKSLQEYKILKDCITRPTIDDAINVVEGISSLHCRNGMWDNLVTKEILLEVYTALRGLKGE